MATLMGAYESWDAEPKSTATPEQVPDSGGRQISEIVRDILGYDLPADPPTDCQTVDSTDQDWFLLPQWQRREAEADREIAEGKIEGFNSPEAFLADLDDLDGIIPTDDDDNLDDI